MSSPAIHVRPAAARARSLVLPREHGAWGLLLVPLATGGAVGLLEHGRALPVALFAVAALALFWMRTPVESLVGTSPMRAQSSAERRRVLRAVIALGVVATVVLTTLLWGGRNLGLLTIGAGAALAFIAQAGLKQAGRSMRMTAQVVGAMGLVCTAPAAYYVSTGSLDTRALGLWLANFIFAGNQIHYVQVRIHAARAAGWREKIARADGFFSGHFALALALGSAWWLGLLPGLALLAFVPIALRGLRWFFRPAEPLNVRRLGWTELAHALGFAALLIGGFRLSM
jgi:hypothetical protein